MAAHGTERRGNRAALAALTAILALAEGGLAAIGALVWQGHRDGHVRTADATTFLLVGASAALGVVIMLLAVVAFARGDRGHGPARLAAALAWLRAAGVIIALVAVAASYGSDAIAGPLQTFGAIVAVLDAGTALLVTGVALRRTRPA